MATLPTKTVSRVFEREVSKLRKAWVPTAEAVPKKRRLLPIGLEDATVNGSSLFTIRNYGLSSVNRGKRVL